MEEVSRFERRAAGLPLLARRHLLRLEWRYAPNKRALRSFGLSQALRSTLKVPLADAVRIDREATFADRLVALEWLALLERSPKQIMADWAHVSIPRQDLIERTAADGRPVILAPIHMGCFALPFARLVYEVFPKRAMLILRAREDREVETKVMRRISEMGVEMRFLNIKSKQDYVDAVRFARAGSVIVSFVDLPGSYGGPVNTTFFGRDITLAMGLDSLARVTDASVIPIAVTSSTNGDILHAGRPFEVYDSGQAAKTRVTTIVRDHMERSVLAAPHQWFMWQRLGEFLVDPQVTSETRQ